MESAFTGEIASSTVASIIQPPPSTSQLHVPTMEVQVTSSTELNVSSSTEQAPVHPVCTSTILTYPILSTGEMCTPIFPSTSTVDIPVCTLPSVSPILSSISVLDSVSISIQSLLSPLSTFTANPSSSTIVSIPKVKPVVETKHPTRLLITGKEIDLLT